jgi:hypothetical protein
MVCDISVDVTSFLQKHLPASALARSVHTALFSLMSQDLRLMKDEVFVELVTRFDEASKTNRPNARDAVRKAIEQLTRWGGESETKYGIVITIFDYSPRLKPGDSLFYP